MIDGSSRTLQKKPRARLVPCSRNGANCPAQRGLEARRESLILGSKARSAAFSGRGLVGFGPSWAVRVELHRSNRPSCARASEPCISLARRFDAPIRLDLVRSQEEEGGPPLAFRPETGELSNSDTVAREGIVKSPAAADTGPLESA